MNKNDKLQNSLKKAFEEHHEPLHEAQWERLNAALDEKPRRRFIPWFYTLGVIGMICLAFMLGYYFNSGNQQQPVVIAADETPLSETPNSGNATAISPTQKIDTITKTPANTSASTTNTANSKDNSQPETDKKPNTSMANNTSPIQKATQPSATKTNTQPAAKPATVDIATTPNTEKAQKETIKTNEKPVDNISDRTTEKNTTQDSDTKSTNPIADKGNTEEIKAPAKDSAIKNIIADNGLNKTTPKDSSKKTNGKKKKEDDLTVRKKFAFTLASGISTDKGEISKFKKPANMHKDSRMLFEQSNSNNQSFFLNLGFEWYPSTKLSLIFNSGLQYREFSSIENINYKYNEVPWHNIDGSIAFYIPVHDTNNPIIFTNKSTLKTKYVNIPLRFGYTFSLHPKHDLMPSLGANISKIIGVEGNTFSLNDAEIKPLKDIVNKKINIGWIAGMQYSYNIYKPLWLGLEMQWQQNVYHYNTRYGSMSGKFNTYNYNMILKYKF
ncbi:MAG: hypothetical protein V4613_00320 [Bacteroidota bacterium]